jgi:hypothetical protein
MPKPILSKNSFRWFSAVALLASWSHSAHGQYDPDWARNFRVGLLTGFNIDADFRTSGSFPISGSRPGPTGVSGADHIYDDGYVRVDNTGNAQGYTTFWGYNRADQYDAANNRLLMQSTSSFSTSSKGEGEGDTAFLGLDLAYGGVLWRGERLRVGWEFGFGFLPIMVSDNRTIAGTSERNTYAFSIPNGVSIPGAPYQGGSSGFDQPSIFDIATLVDSDPTTNAISGSRTLDVTLYAFRLGPTLFWDLNRSFGLSISAGPAVGIVTGDYQYNEKVGVGMDDTVDNKGKFSATEIVYGGYVSATVTYHATLNGDFYLSAQYMPLGSAEFSKGGRSAKLDLSGAVYLSAGINWPF